MSSNGMTPVVANHITLESFDGSLVDNEAAAKALRRIQLLYPPTLLLVFIAVFIGYGVATSGADPALEKAKSKLTGPGGKPLPVRVSKRKISHDVSFSPAQRLLFVWLSLGLIAAFLGSAANVLVHALILRKGGWWCGESAVIYIVGSAFLYTLFLISILDSKRSPTIVQGTTWILAFILEVVLMGLSASVYTSPHHEWNSLRPRHDVFNEPTQWEIVELGCSGIRILLLFLAISSYLLICYQQRPRRITEEANSDENSPLLRPVSDEGHRRVNSNHGTFHEGQVLPATNGAAATNGMNGGTNGVATAAGPKAPDEAAAFYRPTTAPSRSWWEYVRGYSLFFPYLWPSKSLRLQLTVLLCFALVIMQRVINFLVPVQAGKVTNLLSGEEGENVGMPWLQISLFIVYKLLQGPSGILGAIRSVLWIPVAQFSYAALSTASFEHVHGLSLEFHLGKRTGEVISALSKGGAINTFLEQVTFQVIPMLIDLGAAIVYFQARFDSYYSLTLAVVTFWYLYLTIRLAQWRAEQRRQMINMDREEDAVKNDSLQSYETVKYFGAEVYEFRRYSNAVGNYQKAERSVLLSLNVMNISQNLVFMVGLLVVSFIAAYQVTSNQRSVGDFVALLTYMQQLQGPLNFFGTFYRSVQSAMISGERLLELFKEQPSVTDEPDATSMPSCEGQISFEGVKFAYDKRKPALENLSFTCAPGTTTALVGESGGGKSTIFRLLFRFYNFQEGSILLDDKDVRSITIQALRSHIGVVPQDTVLFNESLLYNLRYANQKATDEEIYNACRAASIHDKILSFPDGYQTKVGERGLRLSGGEKQRVAIARTILKNPRIIMLDEATAALDSETEQNIQEALQTLSKGRTMLVIAHRLSTITNADQILVLHQGAVAESGTHSELLAMRGRYATMWKKQIRAERAAEEARVLVDRAEAIRNESLTRPSSRDGGGSEYVSENDTEGSSNSHSQGIAGIAGRAADRLRGATTLFRQNTDEHVGKPPGHP